MSSAISSIIRRQGVVILDGAQGTELERRGFNMTKSTLWSSQLLIDDPAALAQVHLDYLRSGSDIITTFTYQACLEGFEREGISSEAAGGYIAKAVDLAAAARRTFVAELAASGQLDNTRSKPLVAFSCGSYGAHLCDGSEFTGHYADAISTSELQKHHALRLEPAVRNPEIDLIAFETVPCLKEAVAIIELLADKKYGKPAWLTFSCKDEKHTSHGEDFCDAVAAVARSPDVIAVGVNCTAPTFVEQLLQAAKRRLEAENHQDKLLICYPNSGELWDGKNRCWFCDPKVPSSPEHFAEMAHGWVSTGGAQLVGGCCRTTPQHIEKLRQRLCHPIA